MKIRKILSILVSLGIVVTVGLWFYSTQAHNPTVETIATIARTDDERLSKGKKDAPVQMVEYIDMFCVSCARAHEEVIPKIESDFIVTDKLHYEVRVVSKVHHVDAKQAAYGAYCAAEQSKFWNYVDLAYKKSAEQYKAGASAEDIRLFSGPNIRNFAREVGVNVPAWENCVKQGEYENVIKSHEQDMSKLNAYGTPHSVINGENYNGAPSYQAFKTVIGAALDTAEKQKKKENK